MSYCRYVKLQSWIWSQEPRNVIPLTLYIFQWIFILSVMAPRTCQEGESPQIIELIFQKSYESSFFFFSSEIVVSISNKSSIKLLRVSSYNNCSIDKSMPGPFWVDILSMVRRRAAVERLGCTFEWLLVSKVLWYQTEAELRWLGAQTIMKSCSGSLEPSCISSPSLNSEIFHPSLSLALIPPGNHHDLVLTHSLLLFARGLELVRFGHEWD